MPFDDYLDCREEWWTYIKDPQTLLRRTMSLPTEQEKAEQIFRQQPKSHRWQYAIKHDEVECDIPKLAQFFKGCHSRDEADGTFEKILKNFRISREAKLRKNKSLSRKGGRDRSRSRASLGDKERSSNDRASTDKSKDSRKFTKGGKRSFDHSRNDKVTKDQRGSRDTQQRGRKARRKDDKTVGHTHHVS